MPALHSAHRAPHRPAWRRWIVAVTVAACAVSAGAACSRQADRAKQPLIVFAASDLRDALTEIARDHRAGGGDSTVLVFGSTGDLATQIANGAPADLFFAANAEAIDQLAARGSVVDSTREVYAIGRLALIARCCARIALSDLAADSLRVIAIADPSHAPYGRAARQALERSFLWTTVQRKLVLGANVSQAELFVSSGNADAGIVALSLMQRDTSRAYTMIDSSLHDPLVQTVVITSRSTRQSAAHALIASMQGAAGRAVMRRYGFEAPPRRRAASDS